ncbi:MAG: ribose-phosphate diphosphokinase [Candidatus Magasanikbacteria bacterium]
MPQQDIKLISTSSHPSFAQKVAEQLNEEMVPTELFEFSNDNMMFKILESVRGSDVFIISTQAPPVHKNLWEAILAIDAAKRASAKRVTAVLPYFPYARSDQEDQPRISIGARCLNSCLESCGADRVLTTDLHSDQIQAFFSPEHQCDQLKATRLLCNYLSNNLVLEDYVLVAPDPGAVNMIQGYQNKLGLPLAIIDKRRDDNQDKPQAANVVGEVEGKNCLIIDDEVSSGGTLMEAAELLKEKGANKVVATCVHPVLGADAPEKIPESEIDKLITTDTIPTKNKEFDKLEVKTVTNLFANAIKRINKGESISSLFN